MALTVTVDRRTREGNREVTYGTITFDDSYPTGGEAITAANVGLGTIEQLVVHPSSTGHVFPYDYSAAKVLAFNGTTEIANEVDLSAQVARYRAVGIA